MVKNTNFIDVVHGFAVRARAKKLPYRSGNADELSIPAIVAGKLTPSTLWKDVHRIIFRSTNELRIRSCVDEGEWFQRIGIPNNKTRRLSIMHLMVLARRHRLLSKRLTRPRHALPFLSCKHSASTVLSSGLLFTNK